MKKFVLIGLVFLLAVLAGGCASLVEVRGNLKTVYGDVEKKVKIDKIVPYKLVLYKAGIQTTVTDEVLLEPSETQKRFAKYFIQFLKKEFERKGIVLVESNQEILEIRIAYHPGKKMLIAEFAGTHWIIKNTDKEIKRMVVGSFWGYSDEQKIKDLPERLAHESFQDFLKFL